MPKSKRQTLGGAIMGTFIGLALVIFSPLVLWQAESQHRAKDFTSAIQVEATDVQDGYVTFEGEPSLLDESTGALECPNEQECYYYRIDHEELVTIQEEECGSSVQGEILYRTGETCDEDGTCETCYMTERQEWQTQSSETSFLDVLVGEYQVEMNGNSEMIGTKSTTVNLTETTRDVWTYFPVVQNLRVAGDANQGRITGSVEKTFVLSSYSYEQTLQELQSRDDTMKWIFRLITLAMLLVGYGGVFGILTYFGNIAGKVPLVGRFLKEGFGAIVGLIIMALAVVTFGLEFAVISLVKNIWIVAGLLALIAAGVVVWMKVKKED